MMTKLNPSLFETITAKRERGETLDQCEDYIVTFMGHMTPQNQRAAYTRMRVLEKHYSPGNFAHHELANRWGYQFDYSPADAGEGPPQ